MALYAAALAAGVLALGATGCSASVPHPQPAYVPPTPITVTVENPGGDAADPEWAALDRLSREPWAARRDRTNTLIIPLADARHWQRVRLWGYPTRAAFRFGDDHYGIVAIWYQPTTESDEPGACLTRFLDEGRPVAEAWGARITRQRRVDAVQRAGQTLLPMAVEIVDAEAPGFLSDKAYAGALAAYKSWPGTCLIEGFVVVAGKHPELASKVRDRWVDQGATRLRWHARLQAAPEFDDK